MPYAAVVYEKDQPMKIEEVRYRDLQDDEVRVKLAACGVCHSDLSILNELYPCPTPVILGHEAAGVVEEVGPKVGGVAKGDHVVGVWKPSCGSCRYCKSGKAHLCKLGEDPTSRAAGRISSGETMIEQFLGIGGFSEATILSENALVKIDPSLDLAKAALLGCAVLTGFGAAQSTAGVKDGDEVAVYGCGGVGLNIIQGARECGAKTIIAVDLDDAKLEQASEFGATHCLNASTPDLHKAIRGLTEARQGVDYAFDAVGSVQIVEQAFRAVCKGGEVILVGIDHMKNKFSFSDFQLVVLEKGIRGCMAGSLDPIVAVGELISLYQNKRLKLDELITRTYSLNEANDAMNDLREGKNARGVLVFD